MSVVDVNRDDFWDIVADGLVLVDVWSRDCQPCLALAPHLERLAEERPGLTVAKLEAPQARRLCMELRVVGLPTLLLFREGTEVDRLTDRNPDVRSVETWIDKHAGAG